MKVFLIFVLTFVSSVGASAQTIKTVEFAKGARTTVVKGELERGQNSHLVFARSGQIIKARAKAEHPDVYVLIYKDKSDEQGTGEGKQADYTVLKTGKYLIDVGVVVRIGSNDDEKEKARRTALSKRYELEISLDKADAKTLTKAREEARKPKPADEPFPPLEIEKPKR